nr:uncharacterized protein LOC128678801 [Plodia interpunctella]
MLKAVVCLSIFLAVKAEESFISKGQWLLESIGECDRADMYEIQFNITRYRWTRGVDAVNATFDLSRDVTIHHSFEINVEKMTNGGWKNYQIIKHHSFLQFIRNNTGENFDRLMNHMNLEYSDPDPIPKNKYIIHLFIIDICQLPEEGIIGEYRATTYLFDETGVIISCAIAYVTFTEEGDICGRKTEDEDK